MTTRKEIKEEADAEAVHQAELAKEAEAKAEPMAEPATIAFTPPVEPVPAEPVKPAADPLQAILNAHGWQLHQFGDRWTVQLKSALARWPEEPSAVGRGSSPREAIEDAVAALEAAQLEAEKK